MASASTIATEYASSPDEQAAHQTRIVLVSAATWISSGTTSWRSASQASGSRKKLVTLIRMVSNNAAASSG